MTTITINEETIAAIDLAAEYMGQADEGLSGLNMTEGHALADMFLALGYGGTARSIRMDVWQYEAEDCRDPKPMVDADGNRYEVEGGWPSHDERKLGRIFDPRRDWEDDE